MISWPHSWEKNMADEKQIPLDELFVGSTFDPTGKHPPSLAEIISALCRISLARSLQDQATRRSSLPRPADKPKK
jgi:hypothetical protein